jgi:hypothetical protein
MASIQMPLKAEMQQMATEAVKEEAVEMQTTATHLVILDQPKANPPTSLPTSVIVTSRPGPKPSLFGKECQKEKGISSKTPKPPMVEQKKTPTVSTSNFFVPGPANVNQVKDPSDQPITLGSLDPNKDDMEEEREFFDMLFNFDTSNLEHLAPHNGDDCFEIKTADHQVGSCEQTTTEDNIKSEEILTESYNNLNDIESFCELMRPDWSIVSGPSPTGTASGEEPFCENDELLLRPEDNLMWGVTSGISKETDSKQVKVIWGGGTKKDEGGRNQKRRMFEVGGELPAKIRVVQSTSDFLLSISQELG